MVDRASIFVMFLLKFLLIYYLDFDCNIISNSLKSMYEDVEQSLGRTLNTRLCSKKKKTGEPYRLPILPVIVFIQFSWLPKQSIIQLTS